MADTPPRVTAAQLTIREAATWLDPPITEEQIAALIRVAGVKSTGQRRTGKRGRPELTYDAAELMRLHRAIMEWLLCGTCIRVISLVQICL